MAQQKTARLALQDLSKLLDFEPGFRFYGDKFENCTRWAAVASIFLDVGHMLR
jgi:hypothetical protein